MASTITLERDGHDQPWGFRLQGGVDVGIPLSVQRVLVGTPAEGVLLKGDVITKISQTDAKNLTHQQAADLFNNAGNQIAVSIKRSGHSGGAVPVVNGTSSTTSAVPASPPVSGGVALPGLVTLSTARSSDNPALASLPQTQFMLKSDLPTPTKEPTANLEALSIQNQPYRTTPLITPGAKVKAEIGTGSMQHLKMQEDHITGVKEPQYVPVPQSVVRNQKANEILMKQKRHRPQLNGALSKTFNPTRGWLSNEVTGTLNQIQKQQYQTQQTLIGTTQQQVSQQVTQQQVVTEKIITSSNIVSSSTSSSSSSSNVPVVAAAVATPKLEPVVEEPRQTPSAPKQFNSPAGLYSAENAKEALQQSAAGLNPVSGSSVLAVEAAPGVKGTRTPTNTYKPPQVLLTPSKDYNPKESATWRALQETDAPIDPDKIANYSSMKEHDPVYAEIYQAPKLHSPGERPAPRRNSNPTASRSPVAEFLPFNLKKGTPDEELPQPPKLHTSSAVMDAALADSKPMSHQLNSEPVRIPMYEEETFLPAEPRRPGRKQSASGGKKRIAQCNSFNKLMMDVLGE
ncbi:uncharacterized protein LOC143035851 isoform X3 [Oratosquilla oratoria]|uniref:uncharacterized protein LOC143035851 isoform X3 n=1 Tax=Oratosquilla oratoria TaxID=337810 RepID=UPI003F76BC87